MQPPRRTKLRHQADLETSQLLLKQLALSRNCVNAIQQPLRQGHPDQSTCANVEQLLARALPYLELAPTLLLCIRGELHDCLRAAALRLCGQHAYAHNHATQARGEACPGYSRDPPQQSHLQRNAQFLDDIFVGDVPRLRSTPGRNVKMAAHPYPYAAHLTLRYREKTATWGAHARPWRSSSPSMISSPTPHVDLSSCPSMQLGVGRPPTIP